MNTLTEPRVEARRGAALPARPHGLMLAAGVPTFVTWLHSRYYGPWIVDDAGLTFAYARSIATGSGPVLQPGAEPVEGYSNPSWLAIMVVGRWLGLFDHGTLLGQSDIVTFPKLVALACCFGIFAAMFVVATAVTQRPVLLTVAAGCFTASVPSFVIWTTSGLENALLTLAIVGTAAVLARAVVTDRILATSTAVTVGALAALAALTRPEGVLYVAAYPLVVASTAGRSRRGLVAVGIAAGTCALPLAAHLCWRIATFGDYLPNTARAKEQGLPTLHDLSKTGELIPYLGWVSAVVGIGLVSISLTRPARSRPVLIALLITLGLAVVAFTVLETDWMAQYRFATPIWPLASLTVAVAASDVLRGISARRMAVAIAVGALATAQSLAQFGTYADQFRTQPTVGICSIALNTGYQMNGYADIFGLDDGTLLAVDGGGSSLTSRLRFIDFAGLADAQIAGYWQRDDMAGLRDHVLADVRPTFVRLWTGWDHRTRVALPDDPRFERDYVQLTTLGTGGGEWVRREVATSPAVLERARTWGAESLRAMDSWYDGAVPVRWRCDDTLRPSPVGGDRPGPLPPTRT
ncbi:hypothetical protein [Mycolicibacterium baixiangningiae]|uniref:hypothetical protein n=1 Tax=Mycolicibacterium baixiangningiae TaxID=2761578 RepID=UPI0018D0533B|nr:hypothetical protein [Mycolicibacterium baixiangningiae]